MSESERAPALAFFDLNKIFSFLGGIVSESEGSVESKGFKKLDVSRKYWGEKEPLELWRCPLVLSFDDVDHMIAEFCDLESLGSDYHLGRIKIEKGRCKRGFDEDEDSVYENLDLSFGKSLLLKDGKRLPRKISVNINVESYEGEAYRIRRRDQSSFFGLLWGREDFSKVLLNNIFYSKLLEFM